jgi:hypothetical protein
MADKVQKLRSKYDKYSRHAERAARLIILGLLTEIVAVPVLHKSGLEALFTIGADVLIVAGIWGEIALEKIAKEAGDGMVAEANRAAEQSALRAKELELEIAKLTSPRTLSVEQTDTLTEIARGFWGTEFFCSAQQEPEAANFMFQIGDALAAGGWRWHDCTLDALKIGKRPAFCPTILSGIEIGANDEISGAAKMALVKFLRGAGFETEPKPLAADIIVPAIIHISVGQKTLWEPPNIREP